MSRARVGLFLAASLLAVLWSAQVLLGHVVRLRNETVVEQVRAGEAPPAHRALSAAIAEYQFAMRYAPCNTALYADLSLLMAQEADSAMTALDAAQGDAPIEAMQHLLMGRLACSPRDGKAWLDVAMLQMLREGVTERALTSYRMSALASPSESWVAKKRLEFALAVLPLLSPADLKLAQADLAVLERAHPNSMSAVQAAAKVETKQDLYHLFGATAPVDVP